MSLENIPVVILAGGLATRLLPITAKIPKALVEVAGEPFLAHQLRLLHRHGFRSAVLCIGYLGEMIQERFGDGAEYGVRLHYSFDGPVLLGTGGAIVQALPLLGPEFVLLYGDSYLLVDYSAVYEAFLQSGKPALMTVFENRDAWDRSNVIFENGEIVAYDKRVRDPRMRHIDYGLSVFRRSVFEGRPAERSDLADVQTELSSRGELAGWLVTQRFFEIGSPSGLAELEQILSSSPTKSSINL